MRMNPCMLGLCLLAACSVQKAPVSGWRETDESPPGLQGNEGYAWDGSHNFIISQARIDRRADDQGWSLENSNTDPFRGLAGRPNHLGGGQAYGSFLYVPAEIYHGCDPGQFSAMSLAIYDAASLRLIRYASLVKQRREVSAVAIAPDHGPHGVIYVSSYCDDTVLSVYDLSTLLFLGVVKLHVPIPFIQGMSYRDGTLFVAAAPPGTLYPESVSHPDRTTVYAVIPTTGAVRAVYDSPVRGETEGMQWKRDKLIIWINSAPDRAQSRAHILTPR